MSCLIALDPHQQLPVHWHSLPGHRIPAHLVHASPVAILVARRWLQQLRQPVRSMPPVLSHFACWLRYRCHNRSLSRQNKLMNLHLGNSPQVCHRNSELQLKMHFQSWWVYGLVVKQDMSTWKFNLAYHWSWWCNQPYTSDSIWWCTFRQLGSGMRICGLNRRAFFFWIDEAFDDLIVAVAIGCRPVLTGCRLIWCPVYQLGSTNTLPTRHRLSEFGIIRALWASSQERFGQPAVG